jgi:RNA polymerase sigma factor (TIGR02999 family)
MGDITRILQMVQRGTETSAERLFPMVYEELRRMAKAKMANEAAGQTLQPTALVHEAWLRLGGDAQPSWQNRAHFFSAAAEAMRRILIDNARRKLRLKRGGGLDLVPRSKPLLGMEAMKKNCVPVSRAMVSTDCFVKWTESR